MNDALGSPQSVVLLGAGSEIGQAIVRALVERRARTVVLAGRHPAEYKTFADDLRTAGAERVECVEFDATATTSHEAFVADVVARIGDVDLALLAWGVQGDQTNDENDPAAAVEVMEVNLVGAVSVGVALSKRLRQQGHGVLAVLSSVAGQRARRSNFVYGASKAGLDAFFTGLGDSLVGSGARVLVVRPGFVHTKLTAGMKAPPLSTTPDEVAAVVVRALETGAEEVWAPRPFRWVMVVLRHLPRPVFRRLPL